MKRTRFTLAWLIGLSLLALVLVACERPIPVDSSPVSPAPTTDPSTIPTVAIPTTPPEQATPAEPTAESTAEGDGQAQPTAAPTAQPTAAPDTTERPDTYVVQRGDTLYSIAQAYGLTVQQLAEANDISNVNRLDVGDELTIPDPEVGGGTPDDGDGDSGEERIHVVQRGENLFRIGLRYGFSFQELADYNDLDDPTRIEVGQEIRIPPDND